MDQYIVNAGENELTERAMEGADPNAPNLASAIVDAEAGPQASPEFAHERFGENPDEVTFATPLNEEDIKTGTHGLGSERTLPLTRIVKPRHCTHCTGGADEKQGYRIIVGGAEYSPGGWGQYNIEKRRSQWDIKKFKAGEIYGGRTYIGGAEIAEKMAPGKILGTSLEHLAENLGKLEDKLCDPSGEGIWECLPPNAGTEEKTTLTVPALTSDDVRAIVAEGKLSDADDLEDLADSVNILAASIGLFLDTLPPIMSKHEIPPKSSRSVRTSDDTAVLKLEADAIPFVSGIEKYQALLAARIDKVNAELKRKFT